MKTLKMLVLIVSVTFSTALFANTNPTEKFEPKTVSETVGELLKNPSFDFKEEIRFIVELTVNKDNELIVLSVDSEDDSIKDFVINRLNYKKISKEVLGTITKFKVPVLLKVV